MLLIPDILPPLIAYLVFILNILMAYKLWQSQASNSIPRLAALAVLLFGLADWLMLVILPRLHLSYGPVNTAWFLLVILRISGFLAVTGLVKGYLFLRSSAHASAIAKRALILWGIAGLILSGIAFDAMYIEPFRLRVTRLSLPGPAFLADRPLRILQLTDTHVERITRREADVINQVDTVQPDLIVLTGDYVNLDYLSDPTAIQETRSFFSRLHAPYGIYAVSGSVESPEELRRLVDGLPINVLDDAVIRVPISNQELYIVGVTNRHDNDRASQLHRLMDQVPAGAYSILLYHKPDLIEAAAQEGIDLYFAGHTHGGQVQMPFIGPVITLSEYGKEYAEGLHTLGPTTLYVSHGLGMEGFGLPRARFLCPPEIVVMDILK